MCKLLGTSRSAQGREEREEQERGRTEVDDAANLLGDHPLGVPPGAAQEVGDDVDDVLADGERRQPRVGHAAAERLGREEELEPLAPASRKDERVSSTFSSTALVVLVEARVGRARRERGATPTHLIKPLVTDAFLASSPQLTILASSSGSCCSYRMHVGTLRYVSYEPGHDRIWRIWPLNRRDEP